MSTLGFGARVSEISLGAAKKNVESGAIFEAKEAARRQEREAERAAREVHPIHPPPTTYLCLAAVPARPQCLNNAPIRVTALVSEAWGPHIHDLGAFSRVLYIVRLSHCSELDRSDSWYR